MAVALHHGDMLAILPTLGERFHAVVTDPPYHLASIVRRFSKSNPADVEKNATARKIAGQGTSPHGRAARGFMGKEWDGGDIAFRPETWALVGSVMLPGAHLVAFAGTKGSHRMACAIEDAGFEIRDTLAWLYGSGFPKSHNPAKALDKLAGVQGAFGDPKSAAHAGWIDRGAMRGGDGHEGYQRPWMDDPEAVERAARQYLPASELGREFNGWGTALKPAYEPIVLARWPMAAKTVAGNLAEHRCGALNIDACRIALQAGEDADKLEARSGGHRGFRAEYVGSKDERGTSPSPDLSKGRWPANVIHDGSEEVLAAFGSFGERATSKGTWGRNANHHWESQEAGTTAAGYGDQGSAARFFYSAKADAADRLESKHPTVKPVDLMRWLVRLVTPKGGRVLDPFAGSGTTGMACMAEGFDCTLIERESEYAADIRRRLAHVDGSDTPLFSGQA